MDWQKYLEDVAERRYQRFIELLVQFDGSQRKFAAHVGIMECEISRMRQRKLKVSEQSARRMEGAFCLPFGSLDQPAGAQQEEPAHDDELPTVGADVPPAPDDRVIELESAATKRAMIGGI